jgi:GTP-binding protein HflX
MFEVKEKPRLVEKAFLVSVIMREDEREEAESLLEELAELVQNLGIKVHQKKVVRTRKTFPSHILGKGKVEEILSLIGELGCDVIIFDNEISPGQQRNWEEASKVLVIDRHEVILDVFAKRAQTKEASLQVQLARLEYSLPRLRRAWTHLGRQRGGGVTQRGEGEAQIELDQRMLRDKISSTKKEIAQVAVRRSTSRKKRQRIPLPTMAIVGYTNAGKSTLLNRMTGSNVISEDKLFATLDPTSRKVRCPNGRIIVLTDTVGFIRKLPHRLVDSFKATLEEALVADLLLHVVDLSNPDFDKQMHTTTEVLSELGAQEKEILTVYNKIDQVDNPLIKTRARDLASPCSFISSKSGEGVESLILLAESMLEDRESPKDYLVPHNQYVLVTRLREQGALLEEEVEENGVSVKAAPRGSLANQMKQYISSAD